MGEVHSPMSDEMESRQNEVAHVRSWVWLEKKRKSSDLLQGKEKRRHIHLKFYV